MANEIHTIHLAAGDSCTINVTTDGAVIPPDPGPGPDPTPPPSGEYTLVSFPWTRKEPMDGVPLGANQTVAIATVTGNKPSAANNPPNWTVSEYAGVNPGRQACLSYAPGSLDKPIPGMFNNIWPAGTTGTIQAIFSVATAVMGYANVPVDTPIYLNVKDTSGTGSQVRISLATKE